MTLILSLITDDFIIHASDRRLTDLRTGQQLTTKAAKTVICPAAAYMASFTGLAQIAPPMETGEWLMRTLWENRAVDQLESLARATGTAIMAVRGPTTFKRHSFLISGWLHRARWNPNAPLPSRFRPGAFTSIVSNVHDFSARRMFPEPQATFTHSTWPLMPDQRFLIISVGAALRDTEREALNRNVSSALRSSGGRERASAMLLVETIQSVAARDTTVGGGAFVAAIPRHYRMAASEDRPGMNVLGVRWGLPEPDAATFAHIPYEATNIVESPYILDDPFSGSAILKIRKGPVPDLKRFAGIPEAYDMEMRIIPWRSSEELAKGGWTKGGP